MAWKRIIFFVVFLTSLVEASEIKLRKIISLDEPWGLSFVSNEELIVTEKTGKIKLINIKNKKLNIINHNINYIVDGQGGLLDIIYKDNFVWISYSENRGLGKSSTSIAQGKFNKKQINFKNIFRAEPPINSGYHFGSRLVIKDNYLYASAGERGGGMIAQDPTNHPGSIIRIHLDGSIPKDNPKFKDKKNGSLRFIKLV